MTNHKSILVDSSAWILSFRRSAPEPLKTLLREALDQGRVATHPFIILELLQGCKTEAEFASLKTQLHSLDICPEQESSWEQAYRFAFSLRRKGVTVPTIDILIALLAIENNYLLLHHDRHFRLLAQHSDLDAIDFLE